MVAIVSYEKKPHHNKTNKQTTQTTHAMDILLLRTWLYLSIYLFAL